MSDHFDLERFVSAQESVYEEVISELRHGRKAGHWMWFIFRNYLVSVVVGCPRNMLFRHVKKRRRTLRIRFSGPSY